MEKALTQKNTHLKTAASQRCKPKFLREYFFLQPREEFYFFSPTLRCFNFFANAQSTTDRQSDSLLQTLTGQCNLTQTTEARTANMGFANMAGTVGKSTVVHLINFGAVGQVSAFNPPHRKAQNRWQQADTTSNI